jgi:ElaB/YqjD/DUF883 family membrane-anchored ribosome-binding protein
MQTRKVIKDIESVRTGASRILSDLTGITSELTSNAASGLSNAANSLQSQTADELEHIRVRLADLTKALDAGVKKADANIRENPYAWVLGAIGVGLALSVFSFFRKPSN